MTIQDSILSQTTIHEAQQMAAQSNTWSRGRSKADGREFWVIPSRSEAGVAHWVTSFGCTCRGARRRGNCAHQEAVRIHEDQRFAIDFQALRAMYPPCAGGCGAVLDSSRQTLCDDCSARVARDEKMAAARARVIEAWI